MFKTILLPIDLSSPELAKPALAAAVSMIQQISGAVVHFLHVMPVMPTAIREFMPPDYDEQEIKSATEALTIIAQEAGLKSDQVAVNVRKGGVYHEIIEEAAEKKVDLIIMSSHRPAMRTYFLGSNAAHVVRYAKCSVLVVRN